MYVLTHSDSFLLCSWRPEGLSCNGDSDTLVVDRVLDASKPMSS
jgi:hypothetical protein